MLPTSLADMAWLRRQIDATAHSVHAALTAPSPPPAAAAAGGSGKAPAAAASGSNSSNCSSCGGSATDCGSCAGDGGNGFMPNLIVANQLAYGQALCAEALGVPLHMIYTVSRRRAMLDNTCAAKQLCTAWVHRSRSTAPGVVCAGSSAVLCAARPACCRNLAHLIERLTHFFNKHQHTDPVAAHRPPAPPLGTRLGGLSH